MEEKNFIEDIADTEISTAQLINLHIKILQALNELIEKENAMLERLDHLVTHVSYAEKPFIESEGNNQKHNVFITREGAKNTIKDEE